MLSYLATRVFSRAYAPISSSAALLLTANARQHVVARTFLTSASVATPAAKDPKTETKPKPKSKTESAPRAKRRTSAQVKADNLTKKRERAAAARAKAKAAKEKAKEKTKEHEKEKARKAKELARKKAQEAKLTDPVARLKLPLKKLGITKEDLPPKSSPNMYNLFIQKSFKLPEGDDAPLKERFEQASKALGQRWAQMDEASKQPLREEAQRLRQEYEKQVFEWYSKTNPRVVQAMRVQGVSVPVAPTEFKRPQAPYLKFHLEHQGSVEVPADIDPRLHLGYRAKKTGEMWRALSEEEKARAQAEYTKELDEFRKRQQQSRVETNA